MNEVDYLNLYRTPVKPRDTLARHFARLRPWCYFLTLTYVGNQYRDASVLKRHLRDWAKKAQPDIGGDFEYVFVAEEMNGGTHLHGLLYLEAGVASTFREVVKSAWRHGHSNAQAVYRIRSGFKVARYLLKQSDLEDGMSDVTPIIISRSLDEDLEVEDRVVKRKRRETREAAFWRDGYEN